MKATLPEKGFTSKESYQRTRLFYNVKHWSVQNMLVVLRETFNCPCTIHKGTWNGSFIFKHIKYQRISQTKWSYRFLHAVVERCCRLTVLSHWHKTMTLISVARVAERLLSIPRRCLLGMLFVSKKTTTFICPETLWPHCISLYLLSVVTLTLDNGT